MGLGLVDLFIIGAIVHFCILGLYLVRYIENGIDEHLEGYIFHYLEDGLDQYLDEKERDRQENNV